jgi:Sulfotransferase domain
MACGCTYALLQYCLVFSPHVHSLCLRTCRPSSGDFPGLELAAYEREDGPPGMPSDQGIVVTGLPRSGTSWIGKMLEASGQVIYVNEPLNPRHPPGRSPGVLNADVTHRYQYICADNEAPWVSAFGDTLRLRYHLAAELRRNHAPYDLVLASKYATDFTVGKLRNKRALIDDPFGVMSSGWFAERMHCKVVLSVRQPVSVVGSWRKLGWKALLDDVLGQPLLMRDMFAPYTDELQAAQDSDDPVRRAALLWRVTYSALGDLNERQPGLLHIQRYEDLANNPETGYRELYGVCGLDWSEAARKRILWTMGRSRRNVPGPGSFRAPRSSQWTRARHSTFTEAGSPSRK